MLPSSIPLSHAGAADDLEWFLRSKGQLLSALYRVPTDTGRQTITKSLGKATPPALVRSKERGFLLRVCMHAHVWPVCLFVCCFGLFSGWKLADWIRRRVGNGF